MKLQLNRTLQSRCQTAVTTEVGDRGVQCYLGPTDSHAEKVSAAGFKVNRKCWAEQALTEADLASDTATSLAQQTQADKCWVFHQLNDRPLLTRKNQGILFSGKSVKLRGKADCSSSRAGCRSRVAG